MDLEILYEDNHLLALNKPSGLTTQPSPSSDDSLETRAKIWIKASRGKPGNVFLEAIHRLDKGASGIVLFAKTQKALERMMAAVRERRVRKVYHALVQGTPPENAGVLEHDLVHGNGVAHIVERGAKGAKPARLRYNVIKEATTRTLLEIELETGRYHQIRAQLAAIGCPILGDTKYGSRVDWPGGGIALHHTLLEFTHPVTGKLLTIRSPYSPLFTK